MLKRLLALLITLALPFLLVVSSIRLVANDWFIHFEYNTRPGFPADPYGFTLEERTRLAMDGLYSVLPQGEGLIRLQQARLSDGSLAFNEREIKHMQDVRVLMSLVFPIQLIGLALIVILGIVLGGQLVGQRVASLLLGIDMPLLSTGIDTPAEGAIAAIMLLYLLAAAYNLYIPRTESPLQPLPRRPWTLVRDFSQCNARLWGDKLGQISLATTTLFWGIGGNMRVIVFPWAAVALGYNVTQASTLGAVVAIGTAGGAVLAALVTRLDKATGTIPMGIAMGLLIAGLNFVGHVWVAVPFLILLGAVSGYLVVPMNALLQHRGHNLMGAGRSIAVQNFNEQACILGLSALYALMTRFGATPFGVITVLGLGVALIMWQIRGWHARNCTLHFDEVERLLAIARTDKH